jgi:hypothetical protein
MRTDGGAIEGSVGLAVTAAVEAMLVRLPDDAGIGEEPQRLAKVASERMRCGCAEHDQHLSGRVAPMR